MIPDFKNNGVSVAYQSFKTRNLAEVFTPDLRQKKSVLGRTDLNNITLNDGEIMNINNRNVTLNVKKGSNFRNGGDV